MKAGRHFNAVESRELIQLIENIQDEQNTLKTIGRRFSIDNSYESVMKICEGFLVVSGGSTIPDDVERISVERYIPVFHLQNRAVALVGVSNHVEREFVDKGSYANVYKYIDPNYGIPFAIKSALPNLSDTERERFKNEYMMLSQFNHPYLVRVYRLDEEALEYTMEYCEWTLQRFINKKGYHLTFATRKSIAIQILRGLGFIHTEGILHRDLSLTNILIQEFNDGIVVAKISDFGLAKQAESVLTRSGTEKKGTFLDPSLVSYKDFGLIHELFAVGMILSFLFSGKTGTHVGPQAVREIVLKCTNADHEARYKSIDELRMDVAKLQSTI